jgi:hypothetical protein
VATQNLSAQATEGNTPTYRTRYGMMTADKAAQELLDRAQFRLSFLEGILSTCHNGGDGFTLPGYDACGLASILEDVAHDVSEARLYYFGLSIGERWCPEPGKTDDAPEVRS